MNPLDSRYPYGICTHRELNIYFADKLTQMRRHENGAGRKKERENSQEHLFKGRRDVGD